MSETARSQTDLKEANVKKQPSKQRLLGRSLVVFSICLTAIGLFACSGPGSDSSTGPVSLNDVAGEKPITQQDIDLYIKILPEIAPLENDGLETAKVYKRFGMSRVRFKFIQGKIPLCSSIVLGYSFNDNFDKLPESMKPVESELAVVRDNWDDIVAAQTKYNQLSGHGSTVD